MRDDVHVCLNCGTTTDAKASRLPHEVRERAAKKACATWGAHPWGTDDAPLWLAVVDAVAEVLAESDRGVDPAVQNLLIENRRLRDRLYDTRAAHMEEIRRADRYKADVDRLEQEARDESNNHTVGKLVRENEKLTGELDKAGRTAITDVIDEMHRQDQKWGQQNCDPTVWLTILTEEVGELAQAIQADLFGKADHSSHSGSMREEAIQVAAVAVQFVGYLARRGQS